MKITKETKANQEKLMRKISKLILNHLLSSLTFVLLCMHEFDYLANIRYIQYMWMYEYTSVPWVTYLYMDSHNVNMYVSGCTLTYTSSAYIWCEPLEGKWHWGTLAQSLTSNWLANKYCNLTVLPCTLAIERPYSSVHKSCVCTCACIQVLRSIFALQTLTQCILNCIS